MTYRPSSAPMKALARNRRFLPAALLALFLWLLASLPGDSLRRVHAVPRNPWLARILSDPFMHFLTSGLLALLLGSAFFRQAPDAVPFVRVALLASAYGLAIELYQGLLPWRAFGLDDLLWNTAGILFSLLLLRWRLRRRALY